MAEAVLGLSLQRHSELESLLSKDFTNAYSLDNKPIGTNEFVFPQDLPTVDCFFDQQVFLREAWDCSALHHPLADRTSLFPLHTQYFTNKYDGGFCESIPERLRVISYVVPTHPLRQRFQGDLTRGEYRSPFRLIMEGDDPDVVAGNVAPPISKPCVFCYGHENSDDCKRYLSPSARHVRFRNVNFTLMMLGILQICPACLTREHNHVQVEKCFGRQSCSACFEAGHNTALCNSVVHLMQKATPQFIIGDPLLEDMETDEELMRKYLVDDDTVRKTELQKMNSARQARTDRITELFMAHLDHELMENEMAAEAIDNPNSEDQPSNGPRHLIPRHTPELRLDCREQGLYDLHDDHPLVFEHERLMSLLASTCLDKHLDKADFYSKFMELLIHYLECLNCSIPNCSKGKIAAYFCWCGKYGICEPCMFENFHMQAGRTCTNEKTKCPHCSRIMRVPSFDGVDSSQRYLKVTDVATDLMDAIKSGLAAWSTHPSLSPSLGVYMQNVGPPVHLLRMQFVCKFCSNNMNCLSYMVLKSNCDCGYIICRKCAILLSQLCSIRVGKGVVPCSDFLLYGRKLMCEKCHTPVSSYGVCTGLTAISMLARGLVGARYAECDGTLRDLFNLGMDISGYPPTEEDGQVDPDMTTFESEIVRWIRNGNESPKFISLSAMDQTLGYLLQVLQQWDPTTPRTFVLALMPKRIVATEMTKYYNGVLVIRHFLTLGATLRCNPRVQSYFASQPIERSSPVAIREESHATEHSRSGSSSSDATQDCKFSQPSGGSGFPIGTIVFRQSNRKPATGDAVPKREGVVKKEGE